MAYFGFGSGRILAARVLAAVSAVHPTRVLQKKFPSSWAAGGTASIVASLLYGSSLCYCSGSGSKSTKTTLDEELGKLRPQEAALRAQWVLDDKESWKRLPPRAWPSKQPTAEEISELQAQIIKRRCPLASERGLSAECTKVHFDLATARVFNSVDAKTGVEIYRSLGEIGDLDGMVATGVCLIEGLGGERNNEEGLRWLRRACERDSAQGCYELGTLVYTGAAGLEEDEVAAFNLFHRAALQQHAGGLFMVGDCLLEGIGCAQDQARAVPHLLAAANLGHRGARQHLRQLLDGIWHGFEDQRSIPDAVAEAVATRPWGGQDLPSGGRPAASQ